MVLKCICKKAYLCYVYARIFKVSMEICSGFLLDHLSPHTVDVTTKGVVLRRCGTKGMSHQEDVQPGGVLFKYK